MLTTNTLNIFQQIKKYLFFLLLECISILLSRSKVEERKYRQEKKKNTHRSKRSHIPSTEHKPKSYKNESQTQSTTSTAKNSFNPEINPESRDDSNWIDIGEKNTRKILNENKRLNKKDKEHPKIKFKPQKKQRSHKEPDEEANGVWESENDSYYTKNHYTKQNSNSTASENGNDTTDKNNGGSAKGSTDKEEHKTESSTRAKEDTKRTYYFLDNFYTRLENLIRALLWCIPKHYLCLLIHFFTRGTPSYDQAFKYSQEQLVDMCLLAIKVSWFKMTFSSLMLYFILNQMLYYAWMAYHEYRRMVISQPILNSRAQKTLNRFSWYKYVAFRTVRLLYSQRLGILFHRNLVLRLWRILMRIRR
jgi:hypothetical protein